MIKQQRNNLEILLIIVAAWNYHMAESNAICAKHNSNDVSEGMLNLLSFIAGKKVNIDEVVLTNDEYVNDAIDYYNNFKKISNNIKFTRWKSLKNNSLIKCYGIIFDTYLSNGFNTNFLSKMPFFKLTERQFAKIFIKLKDKINK